MIDYKTKYLKYKNKYLYLLEQNQKFGINSKIIPNLSGGSNDIEYKIPNITISYSEKIKDRGAFANQNYNKDDIIEICPALQQSKKDAVGNIKNYLFHLNETTDLVGFGYCSLYNHSDEPNATWMVNDNIVIYAIKNIIKDEEIFVSYGSKWFENRNMSKL